MLHYSLNVRPTLWMMWGLVMQQDKKSSHMFVFSKQRHFYVRSVPRWFLSSSTVSHCVLNFRASSQIKRGSLSLTGSAYSGMTVILNITSGAAGQQPTFRDQSPQVTHSERNHRSWSCVGNMSAVQYIHFAAGYLVWGHHFEILFIFTSWIFHTAWVFFLFL